MVVTNSRSDTAAGVTITDPMPAGNASVSVTVNLAGDRRERNRGNKIATTTVAGDRLSSGGRSVRVAPAPLRDPRSHSVNVSGPKDGPD